MPYAGSLPFSGASSTPDARTGRAMNGAPSAGTVVSMDPQIGDLRGHSSRTTRSSPSSRTSARKRGIDASDSIVIPGFVDTHRHTWEAAIGAARLTPPSMTTSSKSSTRSRRSTGPRTREQCCWRWSASTRGSPRWSTGRINNTPDRPCCDHGAPKTGIRAQYAYGSANLSLADYWFNSKIAFPT
jgi:hypothetical protein